ncbi:DUF5117 domain-containing protein [Mucilaginibacter sp. P19]|uniref:DUF5117 domain-containing protein n=1 Tax=Mucilaginibacter sp. P19 TaxID=3423947 RepID=UPI003D67D918
MKKHPLPGIYLRGSVLALAVLAGSCAARKQAANPSLTLKTITTPGGTVATATTGTPKKEGIKKFSDLIPAKTKADSGLFNTYKVDGKYYYEIPDSLINREMLVVTRFVKTPGGLKTFGQQYGGEEINNQVWKWEKHDKQVFIRVPSYSLRADSTSDMYQSVKNSNLDAILASFEVKAFNKDTTGVLIDVTDFYNGDIAAIGLSDDIKKAYKTMGVDNSRSYIDTIKSFPINIEARTLKTYRAGESPTDNSNAAITFELNTSMLLLPKVPMKARIMDPRVGFLASAKQIMAPMLKKP